MNEKQFDLLVDMMKAIAQAETCEMYNRPAVGPYNEAKHEAIVTASIELVETPDESEDIQKLTARQYMYIAKALAQGLAGEAINPGRKPFDGILSGFMASLLDQDPGLDIAAFHDSVVTQHNCITGALIGEGRS